MRSFPVGRAVARRTGLAIASLVLLTVPVLARDVTVAGSNMAGFGRIELRFDAPVKVTAKASTGVLVITFAEPARVKSERLVAELGRYVSAVRRDPDDTGLRLALAGPARPNILEAGERVFVDLLPPRWAGLPPGLPPEVVAELAERARAAEAKLAADGVRRSEPPKEVRLRLSQLPTLTRLVFEHPAGSVPVLKESPGGLELRYDGLFALKDGGEKPRLAPGIASFEAAGSEAGLTVRLKPAEGYRSSGYLEGDTAVLDVAKTSGPKPVPPSRPAEAAAPPTGGAARPRAAPPQAAPLQAAPSLAHESAPVVEAASARPPADLPRSDPPPATPAAALRPGRPLAPRLGMEGGGRSVLFPFEARTAAAAFERGGIVTLVFDTNDRLDPAALAGAGLSGPVEVEAGDGTLLLRLPAQAGGPPRLDPEGEGWRLTFGGRSAALPPDALKVTRATDENGQGVAVVTLPGAARARWLRDRDGTRLAVVTAAGRVQNLPLPRAFVEFALPATLQGVAVEARTDDLVVGLGRGGVTVTREAGLNLSPAGRIGSGGLDGSQARRLVMTRDAWGETAATGFSERYNELVAETADVPQSGRAESRYRLARFLVVNGMNEEASGILSLAREEDPVFSRRREAILLSGIAAARAGRPDKARGLLSAETLGDDPEAILWRAVVDASERRPAAALGGFRKSLDVIELYPDDLAGPIRLVALKAALDMADLPRAEAELAAIDRLAAGSVPHDAHDLARARVDEAAGRTAAALKSYGALTDSPDTSVAYDALRRLVGLSRKTGAMDRDAATSRLETLSVAWRGGETEIATISGLARLYGEAGRWREMFEMSRRANRYFPDHDLTRALHDESSHLLEALMLGQEGRALSAVQALSLYFDFRELAPVGRRGDEIVRRLADRLVDLDLLDQAADLLQHQVDHRLAGVAKAAVAARLAAIRLLDGKPLLALSALQKSRFSDLPAETRRFRTVLEAQAQSDLSRTDLALEIIDGEPGPDMDRLRVGVLWSARRWAEAGEASEKLVATRWKGPDALADRDRGDVLRAAIAYAMTADRIGLDRLKEKFAAKMLDSPDAGRFDLLLRPGAVQTREFRAVAQETGRVDGLKQILGAFRPDAAPVPPDPAPAGPSAGTDPPAAARPG